MNVVKGFVLAGLCCVVSAAAMEHSPNSIIEEAIDLLDIALTERKDEITSDKEALYGLIDEILLPRFDRRGAAQLVLAKHWRRASDEQRNNFIDAFYGSLLRRYADGVLQFDQGRVEVLPFRGDESRRIITVRTLVTLDGGQKAPVDYALRRRKSEWLIIDVMVEGISYIRTFKAEVNSEIQSTSLDAVISRLQKEINGET